MQLTLTQSSLAQALGLVSRATTPRGTIPIYGHVLLRADGSGLHLAATNSDLSLLVRLDAAVETPGSVSVPARLLTDTVNALPDEQVELKLTAKTQTLRVAGAHHTANVKGMDAAEFPRIDIPATEPALTLPGAVLSAAITRVLGSVAKDEVRPQLAGVLVQVKDGLLTLVGCDSFRLSVATVSLAGASDLHLIVPAKAMAEVARAGKEQEEAIEVRVTDNRGLVGFTCGDTQIVSRLIDGQYVEYARLLDQVTAHMTRATVETADLARAVRFAGFVSRDANDALTLTIAGNGDGAGVVRLEAIAAQVGENTGELEAVIAGEDAHLKVNQEYLADALGAIDAERAEIAATRGQQMPLLVQAAGDDSTRHLIMPMYEPRGQR